MHGGGRTDVEVDVEVDVGLSGLFTQTRTTNIDIELDIDIEDGMAEERHGTLDLELRTCRHLAASAFWAASSA